MAEMGEAIRDAAVGKAGSEALTALAKTTEGYVASHPRRYSSTISNEITGPEDPLFHSSTRMNGTDGAVLVGYGIAESQMVHAIRTIRCSLHGYIALQSANAFQWGGGRPRGDSRMDDGIDRPLDAKRYRRNRHEVEGAGMIRQVALLRGINVGGKNTVPMAALRDLFVSLGHDDVATLLQSGNVVFTGSGHAVPGDLEAAISEQFAITCRVIVVSRDELEQVVADNPFAEYQPTTVHVGFVGAPPDQQSVTTIDAGSFAPEELVPGDRHLYLHLPGGMGRARMPSQLERRLGVPITFRNWTTVTRLADRACG